ncbi:glycosyltransferase [Actinocrinis puniceicyclus]|uniref:Glycosyltransferase n=1 Tax=Actinocrinis puniceicyclus TaxID=977794 RepID=A0A8J7WQW4_9ACTN|nr:glycosyltransferase family 2 protein [Actinocrinis puniceicyclus]MBS2964484.1 glycosyltransferase [Actinocrinis puniceicyclus]
MLAFLLELRNYWFDGAFYPFAAFMLLVWLLWIVRVALLRRYRPWRRAWTGTTSVIIPVVDEPEDLFREVLDRITEQQPTEVIVVINGPRNEVLEEICEKAGVTWVWTAVPGKRNALRIAIERSRGEIAVLVDSDTMWTERTLAELVKPFRNPRIGGVTTRQRILDPARSVLTRWADWLESVRCEYSMPAMSVVGTVGCLPGRTIAFRRQILVDCMERFLTEKFLGTFLEVSDDRTLTNYTLMAGYQTVYQATSLVYTDAPTKVWKLVKQQYRWARGSQYNTLRMMPWMIREARFLALFYAVDILVPFVLLGTFTSWISAFVLHRDRPAIYGQLPLPDDAARSIPLVMVLAGFLTLVSITVRFGRHFAYRPVDLLYLPVFMMINTLILLPVRLLGFFRCAHNAGWGTRSAGFSGERGFNPLAVVPYLLGGIMLTISVLISA